jgi:hypothetical protein
MNLLSGTFVRSHSKEWTFYWVPLYVHIQKNEPFIGYLCTFTFKRMNLLSGTFVRSHSKEWKDNTFESKKTKRNNIEFVCIMFRYFQFDLIEVLSVGLIWVMSNSSNLLCKENFEDTKGWYKWKTNNRKTFMHSSNSSWFEFFMFIHAFK